MLRNYLKRAISMVCVAALVAGTAPYTPTHVSAAGAAVINDNTTAMSVTEGETTYAFDHAYVKPGDTLKVLCNDVEVTSNVKWTVNEIVRGADGNAVEYKAIAELTQPTLPIVENYLECLIYGEIGDVKLTIYCSKLPVIYINSETAYYDVTKEYTDEDTTTINVVGNDTYNDTKYWYNGTGEVKLRGNSTAYRPKRPFKLKLSDKTDLLQVGTQKNEDGEMESFKSKHWVLLANDIDHSLMRNKLLYDFSGDIGTEFYFDSTNVTLIYNGQYEGVYQLCEHRRVDPGRIDITDWTGVGEDAADTIGSAVAETKGWDKDTKKKFIGELEDIMIEDYSWIDAKQVVNTGELAPGTYKFADYGITLPATDGGFLAEMDFYSIGDNTLANLTTAYSQPMYFSAPEPGEDASTDAEKEVIVNSFKETSLYTYAKKYTQSFEYALHSDDFFFRNTDTKYQTDRTGSSWQQWKDATYKAVEYTDDINNGKHYSQMFDMDSLVTNFIFCEYAMNWDSMKNSFFFYKDNGELAKFGPQWDYDWCWGNINMYNIDTWYPEGWHTTNDYFTREQYYQSVQWNRMLARDPYFLTLAYEKYKEVRPIIEEMVKEGGLIDQYKTAWAEAGAANDKRWSYTYNTQYGGGQAKGFEDSVASIKEFLGIRVAWLDKQFESVPTLIDSIGYYKPDYENVEFEFFMEGEELLVKTDIWDSNAKKVRLQINGLTFADAELTNGKAIVRIKKNELKESSLNTIVANAMDGEGKYIYNTNASVPGNYNVVMSNYSAFMLSELTNPDNPGGDDPVTDPTTNTDESKVTDPTTNTDESNVTNPTTNTDESNITNPTTNTDESKVTDPTTNTDESKVTIPTTATQNITPTVNTNPTVPATPDVTQPTEKATIRLNAYALNMKKGTTCNKLKVSGLLAGDKVASWKSTNSKVVAVSKKGKLTAKKVGKTIITVTTVKGAKAQINIKVIKGNIKTKKLTVNKKKISLAKGKTFKLIPTITPITSTDKVTFKSQNSKIAMVSKQGKVKAKAKGTAIITVKSGKKSVKVTVKVK